MRTIAPTKPIYHVYSELWKYTGDGEPTFPEKCPVCQAPVLIPHGKIASRHRAGSVYKCGGQYTFKPQIQNHTNKWWGSCPKQRKINEENN